MEKRNKGTGCIYFREDKDQYEGRIIIGSKYNGKPIFKYVTGKRKTDVQRQLTNIRAQLDNDIVFCSTKGTHISFRNFNRALETICKKASVPRISANITRHTYATVAAVNKAELKTLADILGHKDVSTTYNNYVHPAKEKAKEVAELVSLSMKKTDNKPT